MSLFDAVNHSFTTMSTGGYSTKQASVAAFSPFIQYVIIAFMFIAGTNFTLNYFAVLGKFGKVWKNEEFRYYLGFTAIFALIITVGLISTNYTGNIEEAFRIALFQVVSILTTTGYATNDYLLWAPFLTFLIFILMFFGGSAGSTSGGIKIVRIVLIIKNSYYEFKRLMHPKAILPVRLNKRVIDDKIILNIFGFIIIYFIVFIFGVAGMSLLGLDFETSMGSVIASLGNVGPGIGKVGPVYDYSFLPDTGKWILSFLMLLGRLELFTVLVIFTPVFWRK
jgi:trk system potassium uptake protein TrkH